MTPKEKREDPLAGQRCQATNRAGGRCRKPANPGLLVCEFHGGGTKSAKAAGQRRLESMVPMAVRRVGQLARQRGDLKVALGASKDILDRAGLMPVEQVQAQITYAWDDGEPAEAPAPSRPPAPAWGSEAEEA